MRHNGMRTFSQGVDLRGPLALAATQREGGAKPPRRPTAAPPRWHTATDSADSDPQLSEVRGLEGVDVDEDAVTDRTVRLVAFLRDAEEVRPPKGLPCEGKVVSFDNALAFLHRYVCFLRELGPDLASPQVTFHWTAEENFQSIVESNLRVPSADPSGIKKKHGAAFGRGIYTCPDYKMAKEDFSYGASATFACLALVGRQKVRHHGKGHGLYESHGVDFDSVLGRMPGRNCATWVLPASDQILPCFLVDEVALPAAVAKLREAVAIIREPWPTKPTPSLGEVLEVQEESSSHTAEARLPARNDEELLQATRWRRGDRQTGSDAASRPPGAEDKPDTPATLPYGGDLQAAMRAQDRAAIKLLMTLRDQAQIQAPTGTARRTRWGQKKEDKEETRPPGGNLIHKAGDLLQANEDFIVHQCNCVYSGGAQGVAEAVFKEYPDADVYRHRARSGRPHDLPGTVSVHGRIVNLYGQLLPGRPADDAPPGGWPGTGRFVNAAEAAEDTRAARFRWFEAGLAALVRAVPVHCSLALPTRIGCGLAGGRWPQYLAALKRFCEDNRKLSVVLYDIEGSESMGYQALPASGPKTVPPVAPSSSGFWSSASFEALRDGQWTPYPEARQRELRAALLREDDCLEVLVDAERRTALAALEELGACPRSLGGGVDSSASKLVVRWDDGEGPVEVDLASIVSLAACGEERGPRGTTRVRLHLPAVREGELRLPTDLDHSTAPEAQSCGRRVDPAEQSSGCRICLGDFSCAKRPSASEKVIELFCGHAFHETCLNRWFEESRRCPTCKRRFGHLVGNQPGVGSMAWRLDSRVRLAGHPDSFTIVMNFRFPGGRDAKGEPYVGRSQQAFLPHDEQGKLLLALFQLAFRRRVLFDLRVSATDAKYWPAFNIHLKTAHSGGAERFGFPDEGYGQRVLEELRQNGVTLAEL
ncbi:DTX3 [Symbiodinium natans]|uniref:RING-type E3 ubiquitin transferase n=1 Tax=Symbiodinium natans TaxID=878477 RepID=A0A812UJA6_9DINO|nr:DTX3 [Symbiodinium natans]